MIEIEVKVLCYECGRELDAEVLYHGDRGVGNMLDVEPRICVKSCPDCEEAWRDEARKEGREEMAGELEVAQDRIADLERAIKAWGAL